MSKKAIYAKYGIEYKNNKIFHPVLGWIPELLIDGNKKIGMGVWHFSTLPTNELFTVTINGIEYTIKGTCPCHCVGCYATTGNYNFPSVKSALAIRTWIVYNDIDFFDRATRAQIEIEHIQYLRIHASGDFFSIEYVNTWYAICKDFPECHFWTYTKAVAFECAFDDLNNANIVKSLIPHKGVNYGHCDYILALYEYLTDHNKSVYICRCGIDKDQHCINCKGCSAHEYVLFIEHSTEYKAELDPLFPVLKQIIENQPKQ